ncbi:hypothetical protein LWI28_008227 [Acer negundo]|uniref:Uncharacterized protein n=1 Tax=Acer negundo TaxID=4023 RepID=A0AAD5I9K5_ACENE|nr:hypothetical protein LWI28_008227 [Acer negundo]
MEATVDSASGGQSEPDCGGAVPPRSALPDFHWGHTNPIFPDEPVVEDEDDDDEDEDNDDDKDDEDFEGKGNPKI